MNFQIYLDDKAGVLFGELNKKPLLYDFQGISPLLRTHTLHICTSCDQL